MAPKRSAASAAASGSASDASDGEADATHPSSPSRSKTPPPNPNPNAAAISSPNLASASAAAPAASDSVAAGSDYAAASDSDADQRPRRHPAPKPSSPKPNAKPSSDLNSDSDNSAAAAASDAAIAAAASDDDEVNAFRPPPQRLSRADASAIKPISSRPMDAPRRSATSDSRLKRPRSIPAALSADQKRPQRLWSPADELIILRGLGAYRSKHRTLPGSTHDLGKLHGHIRSQLSVKVSITQLSDKVRRLKQKYQSLASRAKNSRDDEFPTPHDHNIYELAKKVWGTMNGGGGAAGGGLYDNVVGGETEEEQESGESDEDMERESGRDDRDRKKQRLKALTVANGNGNGNGAGDVNGEVERGKDVYPYLWEAVEELSKEHPSGAVFKKAVEVLEGSKARTMEEKLRKFRLVEIRQQLRRMDLMKETVKMVLDALERAD